MENNQIFPEILDKAIFHLEYRVDVAQQIKHEECELEVGVNKGIIERKWNILDGAKGVLGVRDVLSPLDEILAIIQIQKRLDGFLLVEDGLERLPVEEPSRLRRRGIFFFLWFGGSLQRRYSSPTFDLP